MSPRAMLLPVKRSVISLLRTNISKRLMCRALNPVRPAFRRGYWANFVAHIPIKGDFSFSMPGGQRLRILNSEESGLYFYGFPDGYESEAVLPWFLLAAQSRTIIDIGAHIGLYALFAARASPQAAIYAFEPVPICATRLEQNIAVNQLENIEWSLRQCRIGQGRITFTFLGPFRWKIHRLCRRLVPSHTCIRRRSVRNAAMFGSMILYWKIAFVPN